MTIPAKGSADYVNYVLKISNTGMLRRGVINEPRVLYDEFQLSDEGVIAPSSGNPGAIVNGEAWPLRITHVLAALRYVDAAGSPAVQDPLMLNQAQMRFQFHEQYYMNSQLLSVPSWSNKVIALPDVVTQSMSAWDFVANGQPFVLSKRDTLVVEVQLQDISDPSSGVPVTVTFTGIGALSRQPYLLAGTTTLVKLTKTSITTTGYRNDGIEPIVITDMTVNVGPDLDDPTGTGDIHRVRINVRQTGNGTNAQWFKGPITPTIPQMQASLCGVTGGRAVVHQFPGDGLLLEPGSGVTLEGCTLNTNTSPVLCIGFSGYIIVV
jgi:hypothetical protein